MEKINNLFRKVALLAILCGISSFAFGQTPIPISTVAELRALRSDAAEAADKSYILMNDIDLAGETFTEGQLIYSFKGTFDGNGHVIKNFTYSNTSTGTVGFFRFMRGTVKNLGFENANVTGGGNGDGVGVISSTVRGGTLENCWVINSTVTRSGSDRLGAIAGNADKDNAAQSATIKNCYVLNTTVTNTNSIVGGIVGRATQNTAIEKCYVEYSTVYGNGDVGGVVGRLHDGSTIKLSYSANSVVNGNDNTGGVLGRLWGGTVENSYSASRVNSRSWQAGGVVGQATDNAGRISNCYFSGILTRYGGNRASGILGLMGVDNITVENCVNLAAKVVSDEKYRIVSFGTRPSTVTNNYALETIAVAQGNANENGTDVSAATAKTQAFYQNQLGWDFDNNWKMTSGYPILKWQTTPEVSVAIESLTADLSLKEGGSPLSLADFLSGNGLELTFSTTNPKIEVNGTTVSLKASAVLNDIEDAEIIVSVPGTDFSNGKITIKLVPTLISIANANEFVSKIGAATGGDFKLIADIDFTGVTFNGIQTFTGKLDGQGHILTNLNIQRAGEGELGLFWQANGAEIKNLGIENSTIGTADNKHIGAIAGRLNGGSIKGCYVANSKISGQDHVGALVGQLNNAAVIENCYSTAYVKNRAWQTGGLVGSINQGTVKDSYFSGVIVGNWSQVGGIVGLKNGGNNTSNFIINCVNMASYILGGSKNRVCGSNDIALTNNYSLASAKVGSDVAGAAVITSSDATSLDGKDMTDAEAKSASFYATTMTWDMTDTWAIPVDGASYPVLKWQLARTGKIRTGFYSGVDLLTNPITENVFLSGNTYDLNKFVSTHGLIFAYTVNNANVLVNQGIISQEGTGSSVVTGTSTASANFEAAITVNCTVVPTTGVIEITTPTDLLIVTQLPARDYILKNNLDLTGISFAGLCSEATPFTGTFDGNGKVISGWTYNNGSTNTLALFKSTKNATIKNLGIENVSLYGGNDIAGIVSILDGGLVEQCYVAASTISASDRAAGIADRLMNGAQINNCYVDADITGRDQQKGGLVAASFEGGGMVKNCYFAGTAGGGRFTGAMLGLLDRDADVYIQNCLNLATSLSGSETTSRIGTFGGRSAYAKFTNNYSISTTPVNANLITDGTVTDRNGANLPADTDATSKEFYVNTLTWDFTDIWAFATTQDYPVLRIFNSPAIITSAKTANLNEYGISIINNVLEISGLSADAVVSIYNISGQKIATSNNSTFVLPAKGFYVVKVVENGKESVMKIANR